LLVSMEAANYVDSTYPEYMKERFNIEDGNMAVEIESYAQAALFFEKKKRYAQWVRWDEGELVDEIEYTGLELVRSDSSEVTERVQERVIEIILKNDNPKELLHDYLQEQWELVSSGDVPIEEIGKPSAFKNDLWDYGYAERDYGYQYYTPQPHIRGSRYAIEFIDGEDIKSAKPLMYYCDGVKMSSDLPPTYCYENKLNCPADDAELAEEGRELDAIAVEEPQKLPDGIIIDYEKMANKTIRDPIEPIAGVMGMNFDDLITEGKQSGLSEFM
jgi:DNA polymerase I